MNKQQLVTLMAARRDAAKLSNADIALRSGLTERSVRNAFGAQGNPQLSSLLALVDALGLELQLAPKGFGTLGDAGNAPDDGYRPVATRVGDALARPVPAPKPSRP